MKRNGNIKRVQIKLGIRENSKDLEELGAEKCTFENSYEKVQNVHKIKIDKPIKKFIKSTSLKDEKVYDFSDNTTKNFFD